MLMAKLADMPASNGRSEPRRIVNIAARLDKRALPFSDVCVVDLSPDGCRLTVSGSIEAESAVWLKLPGIEAIACRIVWVEGREAGCSFQRALHDSELEQLRAKPRIERLQPGGTFGRKRA
jgi:hypothetical protein